MKAFLFNPALVGTLALFLSALWMVRDPKDKTRPLLVFALILNLFYGVLLTIFMEREGSLFPWKFDPVLFRMDQSLGLQAVWLARPLQSFAFPLWIVYQSMIPMMIGWFFLTRHRRHRGSVIPAYAAELAAGPLLYAIVPACGPVYAFGAQWLHPPVMAASAIRLSGMPNAFPSLHAATALVLVFFAPGKLWRGVALAFLGATCLATLSTGEHYAIDLIPGLAFGAFAANVGLGRIRRSLWFLAVVVCWSLAVRFQYPFFIGHPAVTRTCAALTLLLVGLELFREWKSAPAQLQAASSAVAPQTVAPC